MPGRFHPQDSQMLKSRSQVCCSDRKGDQAATETGINHSCGVTSAISGSASPEEGYSIHKAPVASYQIIHSNKTAAICSSSSFFRFLPSSLPPFLSSPLLFREPTRTRRSISCPSLCRSLMVAHTRRLWPQICGTQRARRDYSLTLAVDA